MNGTTLIGQSNMMEQLRRQMARLAGTDIPVLVEGETGTGKQLVAQALHDESPRRCGPFIEVNCACLPDTLIESELFGSEKGAYTGADAQRRGKFELAHTGTLFLDEIGELSLLAQPKFLRALQQQIFFRVGGQRAIEVDIRMVCATNRNLEEMVANGTFRLDLYERLNVTRLHLPALRERMTDVPELVEHFLAKVATRLQRPAPEIRRDALRALQLYGWPGNIRELENVIYAAIAGCTGDCIELEQLPEAIRKTADVEPRNYVERMRLASIGECNWAMAQARGSKRAAAKLLGLTHTRFLNLLKTNSMDGTL